MAADPSHNVHPDLLPHIHLISAYRYPLVPRFGIPEVTEWLLNSPRIARDGAPFFWTFLDTPQDGSIILTWQPLQRMGTEFASDGYVWPRGETFYQHEIRDGLILEVFHQPMGYRPGEEYATHSRRRFRLMPPKVPNPNAPQVDPSLWLVHYGPVDEREPTPVKKIRLDARLRAMMDHRQNLQRAGQITRKEFMLSDRVNWPQIPLPRDARVPPGYATAGVPQQMAYPPNAGAAGGGSLAPPPPAKRARHSAANAAANAAAAAAAAAGGGPGGHGPSPMDAAIYDDEEEYTRGDMFDVITPRDVSLDRYKQNHEWMEEVISSPYRINQIGYADLGLGLKGELAPITEGIFEGQAFDASQRVPKNPYVGRLDAGLAAEFRKRVEDKISATNDEIAEMKAQHEKLVASLRTNSAMKKAEHDLRFTAEETGPEIWRVEGRLHGDDDAAANNGAARGDASGDGHWSHQKHQKTVDEVVSQVESTLGRKVVASGAVVRVQDGGYREPSPEPEPEPEPELVPEVPLISAPDGTGLTAPGSVSLSQHPSPAGSQLSGILIGDADMDMGDTAAGMLDQMESVFSPASTPVNFPTPGAQAPAAPPPASGLSNVATATGAAGPTAPTAIGAAGSGTGAPRQAAGDVAMADAAGQSQPGAGPTAGGADDWVVVPPGGDGPPAGASGAVPNATTAAAGTAPVPPSTSGVPTQPVKSPLAALGGGSKPESAVPTPGAGAVVDSDFGSLADMSTGGDPLASIDDGLDLNMDMDDSAFGDAFHGSGDN
ncbi:hypothetical protein SPBR_08190 [Sporothrix brasiliensis 5110]|uniref:DUF1750-domain-containing protein n=1 Tax=Sporothrix brasiliensis 5110 TaxID=1398154 RepID=A0A0C2IIB0_9PEZI|nr:uncharacterized protein SPBR_08190 [Sporothrix brasiliensis 5110]KIH86705.1 hypothetical protein SPBR_08190 [Sporothrix brasiliensis 5110]